MEEAARHGVQCQIVAVLDRGDAITRNCIQRFSDDLAAIHDVNFGEPASSRNYAFERIDSKYVATLDGDDCLDRDWLWKGVRFLEECGEANVVAHPEVRLSFGAELHGRLQISTDSYLFHPLNLISSWHYAADLIMPTRLIKKIPQLPNDYQNGLGGEDWHWTCESVVEGIKHAIVPGTCSFYRRQADHTSLGMLPSLTFAPTRLFDKHVIEEYSNAIPSTGIRFANSLEVNTGPKERWAQVPRWLEQSVRNACELDLEFYKLLSELDTIPFETPAFFPAVGQLYLRLLNQVTTDKSHVVFVCDRLGSLDLGLVDSFLTVHHKRNMLELDILIISLSVRAERNLTDISTVTGATHPAHDDWHTRLRYVDLGSDPGFAKLPNRLRKDVVVRLLMQIHPEMVINRDSIVFDELVGGFGRAIASAGARTVRVCPAQSERTPEAVASWSHLAAAGGNYTTAMCKDATTANWLSSGFNGTGTQVLRCEASQEVGGALAYAEALYDLLTGHYSKSVTRLSTGAEAPVVVSGAADLEIEPDVTCVITVQNEGHYLNATLRSVALMFEYAANRGLSSELVVVAFKAGNRTCKVLESLADVCSVSRVINLKEDNIGDARNAGVEAARGRFIAILTGSALVSPGWLYKAVQLVQEQGPNLIAHPQAVVEFGQHLSTFYQPDSVRPELLASEQTWTAHALATCDLFRQTPYRSSSPRSGYGHSAWHWNCETVMAGVMHVVVKDTAVYCREAGFVGEQTRSLGKKHKVTLPPTRFFTKHAWLTKRAASVKRYPRLPRDWNDDAYLSKNPEVGQVVANGKIRTGYDHYMLHGLTEGRTPYWQTIHSTGSRMQAKTVAIRNVSRYYWIARVIWHWRNVCATLRTRGVKALVLRTKPNPPIPAKWDEKTYLMENPDAARLVGKKFLTGYEHYCRSGRADGLDSCWKDQELQESLGSGIAKTQSQFPLPGWMDEETRSFATFEPAFTPTISGNALLKGRWASPIVDVYRSCWQVVAAAQPTHIILMHSLRKGGAELSVLHTIEAILSTPGHRVLVITAECSDNPWQDRLPDGCTWLPFGAMTANCDQEQQIEVLTRLLVNCGTRCLHISYSWLGWVLLRRHAAALEDRMCLFVSVFSIPRPELNENSGYAGFLPPLIPYLTGVLTDNKATAEQLCTVCGIEAKRVTVLRHPITVEQRFDGPSKHCNTVLWASRIDREKRPDLLIQIAKLMPEIAFHVYGESVFENGDVLDQVKAVGNISYCGPFSGFETINQIPYRLFLYTSIWDGLPNVVLEAMQSGLLVVASDVGGISEVVGDDTGVLVHDYDEAEAYVSAIRDIIEHPDYYREKAEAGCKKVTGQFTKSAFLESLQSAYQYL